MTIGVLRGAFLLCSISLIILLPMKLRYASPPSACVMRRIMQCSASPRSMTGLGSLMQLMCVYMAASISQKAMVLSPTRAWDREWLVFISGEVSPTRRFLQKLWQQLLKKSGTSCFLKESRLASFKSSHLIAIKVNSESTQCKTFPFVLSQNCFFFLPILSQK